MPFLAFRWNNLILTFTVAVFELVNSPSINKIFQQLFIFEMKDILTNFKIKDLPECHLSWIDDQIIMSKKGSIQNYQISMKDFHPCISLICNLLIKLGITLNVQKSILTPTVNIEYLGLEYNLEPDNVYFRVQQKCIIDYKIQLIKMFAQGDTKFSEKILSYEINKNYPLWKIFSNFEIKKIFNSDITQKMIQQIMGKIVWINKKYKLDIEILPIDLLLRYPFLSKNTFYSKL